MEWDDHGIVLSSRPFGESGAIVTAITRLYGKNAGFVHGGQSSKKRADVIPGTEANFVWKARLSENLGSYAIDAIAHHSSCVLDDQRRLSAIMSACHLTEMCVPEREPHQELFDSLLRLFHIVRKEAWEKAYVLWELTLLRETGYGLDLSRCAITGKIYDLAYVSPKTGRAVSRSAGEPYHDRLLPLPNFMAANIDSSDVMVEPSNEDVADGLKLTGYFLEKHPLAKRNAKLPEIRRKLLKKQPLSQPTHLG